MNESRLDWQRAGRTGTSEAVLCEPKSAAQIDAIIVHAAELGERLLLTRLGPRKFARLSPSARGALDYDAAMRTAILGGIPEARAAGRVAIVLRDAQGGEESFERSETQRPGIYGVEVKPSREGEFALLFRIDSAAGFEEIAGGRVRVGSAAAPGGPIVAPEPPADEIGFLKEQQWQVPFATAWAREEALQAGVEAPPRWPESPSAS